MTNTSRWTTRRVRAVNRLYARYGIPSRSITGFVSQPEPRTIGSFARGKQLIAGNCFFGGHMVEPGNDSIWDIEAPSAAFQDELHGFAWLDDLAAVGTREARIVAQNWLTGWINRYGRGQGPGWSPDLAGRRVIRWINHAFFLMSGMETDHKTAYFSSMARQTYFLNRRWKVALPGLPRFEALAGLIYAGLSLTGMEGGMRGAIAALARECQREIDIEGGIATRNPEELLEVFTLLTWVRIALETASHDLPAPISDAIARIAPTLRSLRHADGGLARFHGGGRGIEGRLDHALASSGVKHLHPEGLSMGYARLAYGRTTVIVDASPPPQGRASFNAHASTLGFELTSGRRPLIVNCGSGASFGADWRRAGRATPSHSTLCVEDYSSARLGPESWVSGLKRELLLDTPQDVPCEVTRLSDGIRLELGHDGYRRTHGLTHARILELAADGRALVGEDMLAALDEKDQKLFDACLDERKLEGISYQFRLHLHPEVDASIDMGGAAVSMALRSGEIWVFRHDGVGALSLEPSVYLERGRLKPRATKQIVLSGVAVSYLTRIRWSLAKAQESLTGIRDLKDDRIEFA